jgi:hypothetical protein
MNTQKTNLQKKADNLWSMVIRKRDPICRFCKVKATTSSCHIITRETKNTRFDPLNGLGGCNDCHRLLDSAKETKRIMSIDVIGREAYEKLQKRGLVIVKYDAPFIADRIEELKMFFK